MMMAKHSKRITTMIEQVTAAQLPRFAKNSVVLIGYIQKDLRETLCQQGFHSDIFLHDMDEADLFVFKLDYDYFWMYMFRTIQQDHPVTFVETTSMQQAENSMQNLLKALNIPLTDVDIFYDNFEIQSISIQNQLNLN